MGLQSIKGTGLDFVYRWVSLDLVARALEKVRSPHAEERDAALRELLTHEDWGHIDARMTSRPCHGQHPCPRQTGHVERCVTVDTRGFDADLMGT